MRLQSEVEIAEERIQRFQECCEAIQKGMERVVVGQHDAARLLTTGLMSGGHMLLIGVPGLAKTLMVKVMARVLGWNYKRIQFTPDLMPADITGTEILQRDEQGIRREMVFHKGPVFANLVLADEINRTPPKTQAALLEAMQEMSVTVSGKSYALPSPFVVVATQNPIEQEGTYPLPEAQLDRFLFSIHIGYPSNEDELAIAGAPLRPALPVMEPPAPMEEIQDLIQLVGHVPVSRHVLGYAMTLTTKTRPTDGKSDSYVRNYVGWGAGPRATQHLVTAARATALMEGRPSPEIRDVKAVAQAVLGHRILVNYNALGEGIDARMIVTHLLETTREPGSN